METLSLQLRGYIYSLHLHLVQTRREPSPGRKGSSHSLNKMSDQESVLRSSAEGVICQIGVSLVQAVLAWSLVL